MLQYHSDIEQCEVAQTLMLMCLEGKSEEGTEGAVSGASVYAVS